MYNLPTTFFELFLKPYSKEIVYTFLCVVFFGYYFTIDKHLKSESFIYAGYLFLFAYMLAYIVSFITNANNHVARVLKPVSLFVMSLETALSAFCRTKFNAPLSNDFVEIMGNTNANEVSEFFSFYVTWQDVLLVISIVITPIVICYSIKIIVSKRWCLVMMILFLFSCVVSLHNYGMWETELGNANGSKWNFRYDEIVDLRQHPNNPKVVEIDSIHPDNVVIIIGESFARSHSSLYGYEKKTNPRLESLVEKGNVIVFDKPVSPYSHTTEAFRYILNTYHLSDGDNKRWYESPNAIEFFKVAGYRTFWISNQAEEGVFDNLPSSHSKICDVKHFNKSKTSLLDGFLVDALQDSELKDRNCVIYHMMGQHCAYNKRFPSEFAKFQSCDYQESPKNQRQTLADYDNATLYNDYVVAQIINRFRDKDAIVFYFSDHGQDLFNTNPEYAGHAMQTVESDMYGKQIPFIVYVSERFMHRKQLLMEELRTMAHTEFCTDRFFEFAMQVTGYSISQKK